VDCSSDTVWPPSWATRSIKYLALAEVTLPDQRLQQLRQFGQADSAHHGGTDFQADGGIQRRVHVLAVYSGSQPGAALVPHGGVVAGEPLGEAGAGQLVFQLLKDGGVNERQEPGCFL
jgi:hypothetical protein